MPSRSLAARGACAIALTLATGCTSSGDAAPASSAPPDIRSIARASAVDLRAIGCRAEDVRGAGSMIDDGLILTVAHVVAGAESISVRPAGSSDSSSYPAHVVAIDAVNDLALLSTPTLSLPPLSAGTAVAGDDGVAVVFRDEQPVAQTFEIAKPVVVRILDIYHVEKISRPGYQLTTEVAAGDSGAVLVGPRGDAVGVLYAKSREADDRAWASDLTGLDALLDSATDVDPAGGIDVGECAA